MMLLHLSALSALLALPARADVTPLPAGPAVASIIAQLFAHSHYDHHPLDAEISSRTLRGTLDAYDYSHMVFLQSDVDDFDRRYQGWLAEDIRTGNLAPAYAIFELFHKRLKERDAWVHEFAASTFTFTGSDRMPLKRHEARWPADLKEARELWRLDVEYELLQARLGGQKPEERVKGVLSHYDELLRSYDQFDANDVLQVFLGAFAEAFDPHSAYMAAQQEENFDISMRLSLVGIGAVLREDEGLARIVSLVPGGPADADKRLKPNDRIEAVAQDDGPWVESAGLRLDRLVLLIRGKKGTTVRLRVIPADAVNASVRAVIALVRDEIHLKDQEAKARLITRPGPDGRTRRLGVIDLPSFYADLRGDSGGKSTARDVAKLLEGLERKNVDGVVLDLRRNGGGALKEAIDLAGLFAPRGPVVQVKDSEGKVDVLSDYDGEPLYAGPLVVLTARESASASEIVAAALQDYGRAVVVGAKSTFGKGTVQAVVELKPYMPPQWAAFKPGALRLTTQKFYRVSGGSTQDRGVIPDVNLPSAEDYMDAAAESSLPYAMPYDEISPAPHPEDGRLAGELPKLKAASAARVAADPEWGYVREDIAKFRKHLEDRSVSLNLAERESEKKADEDLAAKRKRERAKRGEPKQDVLELTLDNLDGKPVPAADVAASTKPAGGAAPAAGAGQAAEDYEKAPPAPDLMLEESENILSDMAAAEVAVRTPTAP